MKDFFSVLMVLLFIIGCDSNGINKRVQNGVFIVENPEHGLWQKQSVPPISFELERTYGKDNEPSEEVFASISSVFTDDNRNVYIFDYRDNRLASFDSKGNLNWSTGRQGEGPGEFNYAQGAIFDGLENIYIGNLGGSRIDRFDLNGNYLNSFNMSSLDHQRAALEGFLDPNTLVLSHYETGKCGIHLYLVEVSDSLKKLSEITIQEDIGVEVPFGIMLGPHVNVNDDVIAVANIHNYEFNYYNRDGKLRKKITRNFNKLVRPGIRSTDNSRSIRMYSYLHAPIRLSNGLEISTSYWPTNVADPDKYLIQAQTGSASEVLHENMVDLFNSDGELLYSIYHHSMTPEIGQPIHVDGDDKLYTTIYEPFPQLRRYRINIKKN